MTDTRAREAFELLVLDLKSVYLLSDYQVNNIAAVRQALDVLDTARAQLAVLGKYLDWHLIDPDDEDRTVELSVLIDRGVAESEDKP